MKNFIDQALRFIKIADREIKAFDALKSLPNIELPTVCFHAQQAVEKILKAILVLHGDDPTRTHDLNKLAYALLDRNINLPLPIEELSKLNPYAVIFRYDDMEIELISRQEATQIILTVREWADDLITKISSN
jgi:HEPN domain-containing protein